MWPPSGKVQVSPAFRQKYPIMFHMRITMALTDRKEVVLEAKYTNLRRYFCSKWPNAAISLDCGIIAFCWPGTYTQLRQTCRITRESRTPAAYMQLWWTLWTRKNSRDRRRVSFHSIWSQQRYIVVSNLCPIIWSNSTLGRRLDDWEYPSVDLSWIVHCNSCPTLSTRVNATHVPVHAVSPIYLPHSTEISKHFSVCRTR